jgi:REP element-mobilizing transposase RayT
MERFYRRRLPHWRLDSPLVLYSVTWRLEIGQPDLEPKERDIVAGAITYWEGLRCRLAAWVVMNDHVHVVVAMLAGWRMETLVHSWKSFTAHQLAGDGGRKSPVWESESYDRVIRSDDELERTVRYVCSNPLTRWPALEEYPWVAPDLKRLE